MINVIKKYTEKYFPDNSERSVNARKNIAVLLILHSFNLVFSILLLPVSLRCLNSLELGIWLTVSSITTWFVSLDFGLGNGLRNKLSEALAINDKTLARIYISSTYFIISLIILFCYIIFVIVNNWIPWGNWLNAPVELSLQVNRLAFYVFTFFFIQFILKLIIYIVLADQKPAINGLFSFSINLLTIVSLYFLSKTNFSNLLSVGIISSAIPLVVFFIASIILFGRMYRGLLPSLRFVQLHHAKNLVQLGFQFFIIQIASLIVFATDNVIIAKLFTPADVTVYQTAYKYFNLIPLVFGVILTPFWSAYTEAYTKKDFQWIKKNTQKLIKIWVIFTVLIILMLFVADPVYRLLTEAKVKVPFILSIFMGLYSIISMWNNIFAYFVNGAGKIRLQLYLAGIGGIINIPLCIFLAKNMHLGISGIIIATSICLLLGTFAIPIQYYKIVAQKAEGIWNK